MSYRHRYDPKPGVPPTKEKTQIPRKDKWETLSGWSVPAPFDDTDIIAWNKRRTQLDSKPVEQRKGPIHAWEPYVCQTVTKCVDIEDIDSFTKSSIHESLKYVPKSKRNAARTVQAQRQRDKAVPGSNVEIYSRVKEEHEKVRLQKVLADRSKSGSNTHQDGQNKKTENGSGVFKEGTDDGGKDGDGKGESGSRRASANNSRQERPSSSAKPDTPRTRNRLLTLSQTYKNTQSRDDSGRNPGEGDTGGLQSKATTSGSSLGADEKIQERDKYVPKLSYTQSNIKLRQLSSIRAAQGLDSAGSSGFKDEDEDNYDEFVRDEGRLRDVSSVEPSAGDFATPRSRTGVMVTAFAELKERYGSQSDSYLGDADTRSQPSSLSDEEGLAKFRTPTALDSAMSQYSGRSDGDSRKTQKQVNMMLTRVNLMKGEDEEGELTDGPLSNRHAVSLPPPSLGTAGSSPPASLNHVPLSQNTSTSRQTCSEAARSPTFSNHLFPIGELLPAVDRSIRTTMTGHRPPRASDLQREKTTVADLEKEFTLKGKDKLLPYEDTIIMMREGVELVRLRERQQNFLGPPAFRPQRAKTPMSGRRKDSKRLYGQLSQSLNQEAEDSRIKSPSTRWRSSSGAMYSKEDKQGSGSGSELSSPLPPSQSGEFVTSGGKYRAPATPSDPSISCLYKLTRRRKPGSDTSFQSSSTSLDFRDVKRLNSRMMDLIRSKTSAKDFRNSGGELAS